ncbi:MAG: MFS transporter [Alphaproteobacteria bacterium]
MTDTDTQDSGEGRDDKQQSFAALRHPAARLYLIGAALAMMADSIEHVISYWIIFQKFHSPALGGFAVISHWLPFLLFSFYAGVLADRFDPRRIIQIGMGLFMLASLGWGILFLTDSLEMWHAVVLLVIHGLAGVLWAPAGQLLIHEIVGQAQLLSAIRLMATSRTLGLLMGPAVGGGIMLLMGPANGILLNVLIYLPLTVWLFWAPERRRVESADTAQPRGGNSFADIIDTVRRVAGIPVIASMTVLAGATALIVGNAHQAQMPEFATDLEFGDAGIRYTLLLAANAAGALIAGLVLESRNLLPARPRSAFVLAMLWCGAIGGFAVATNYALALALLFCAGFLDLSYSSMTRALAQLHAPAEIRGRVIGLYNMSNLGLRSFSGVTIGIGGSIIGIHWSLAMSAALLLVVVMSLFAWMRRRGMENIPAGEGRD